MLQEDFIPQKGFNSVFSELNNYELAQYPTERDGFFSETATAKKRDGLYTEQDIEGNYLWQTDGDIKGKIIVGGVMFLWDDKCHIYRFEKISFGIINGEFTDDKGDIFKSYVTDNRGRFVMTYDSVNSEWSLTNGIYTWSEADSNTFGIETPASLTAVVYVYYYNGASYALTKVYDNPIVDNSDPDNPVYESTLFEYDMYNRRVKQKALCISYLNKINKTFTADKAASTNDDGDGNVIIAANEAGTFTDGSVLGEENMLAYYIYFPVNSSSQVRGQIRQIIDIPSGENGKQAYLSQMFYSEPTDWLVDEPCEVYEGIEDVIIFNNIRNADGLVLTLGISNSEAHFRDLGGIDIEMFEGRLWMINSYATSIGGSLATGEYEILDPATVRGSSTDSRGQKMDSLILIKNYLLVNMENSMSVVWKMATEDNEVDPIYNINSIINGESAITPDAIFFKSGLYFVNTDTMFEGGNVVAVSSNMIYGETSNQGAIVQTWLDKIEYGDYVRAYGIGRMRIVQHVTQGKTQMLVYDDLYEGWMPRDYSLEIYDKFEKFYDEWVIGVGDKVCFKRGDNDLGQDIHCKVSITGSKNYINSLFSIKKIKIGLGFYNNIQHFKLRLDLGYTVYEGHIEKDAKGVEYLEWNNIAGQQGEGMGLMPIGIVPFGGGDSDSGLASYMGKIGLIGVPIGKKCDYYKLTLENVENYNLNLVGISVLTEGGNTYITPANNVF